MTEDAGVGFVDASEDLLAEGVSGSIVGLEAALCEGVFAVDRRSVAVGRQGAGEGRVAWVGGNVEGHVKLRERFVGRFGDGEGEMAEESVAAVGGDGGRVGVALQLE